MIRAKIAMKLQKMVAADCNQMSGDNHNQKPRRSQAQGAKDTCGSSSPFKGLCQRRGGDWA